MDVTKRFEHFRKIWDFFPQSAPKGQQKPLVPAKLIFMDGGWVYAQIKKTKYNFIYLSLHFFSLIIFFFCRVGGLKKNSIGKIQAIIVMQKKWGLNHVLVPEPQKIAGNVEDQVLYHPARKKSAQNQHLI